MIATAIEKLATTKIKETTTYEIAYACGLKKPTLNWKDFKRELVFRIKHPRQIL